MATSAVHSFTVAANAEKWNRSMFADPNYLIGVGANHPHMLFFATNRDAVSKFLQVSVWPTPGTYFLSTTNDAYNLITNVWWNNESLFTNLNNWEQYSYFLTEVAFTYQLTTNATIAAADPGRMLDTYITTLRRRNYDRMEAYNLNAQVPQQIGECYDWLYPIMTPAQRSNVLNFMESEAQYFVFEDWLYTGTVPNTNRIYTNTLAVKYGSQFREGESHSRNSQVGLALCMAGMGESPILRGLFSYYMSYYIAQFDPFQGDDGRAYNSAQNFLMTRQFPPFLMASILFPDAKLTNAPVYNMLAHLFAYLEPVGYGGDNELEPWCWGVQGGSDQQGPYKTQWQYTRFYDAALLLQSGPVLRQYNRSRTFTGTAPEAPFWIEAFLPYYWHPPAESDWPDTYWYDIVHGWAISMSHPPTDWAAFTNGVGFIYQARPSAAGRINATFTDGQIELWAYGAHITAGGSGNYEEHSMFQNTSLMVDGIGYNNPNPAVSDPWYSCITAFTNTADFTYVSSDLTKAFARTNWNSFGYQNVQQRFYAQATNSRPYISGVNRSVIFPHKKYLVIYDQMQTTQPAHFQWKWNVWRPTAVVNTNNCSFTYPASNTRNGSNVMVYVSHIVDPSTMTLTNMTTGSQLYGTNHLNTAKINPITGENYNDASMDVYAPDRYWPYWGHSIWVQNKTATTNWHFLTVVYPVKWGQPAPTITRIDDYTVHVQQGANDDVISIDPSTSVPTVSLNLTGPSLGPSHLSPPSDLRVAP
jgi:hypothetical protein